MPTDRQYMSGKSLRSSPLGLSGTSFQINSRQYGVADVLCNRVTHVCSCYRSCRVQNGNYFPRFSYFATYFTSLWGSEIKAKYEKWVKYLPIHSSGLKLNMLKFSQFEPEIMLDGMLNFETHFMVWYCVWYEHCYGLVNTSNMQLSLTWTLQWSL